MADDREIDQKKWNDPTMRRAYLQLKRDGAHDAAYRMMSKKKESMTLADQILELAPHPDPRIAAFHKAMTDAGWKGIYPSIEKQWYGAGTAYQNPGYPGHTIVRDQYGVTHYVDQKAKTKYPDLKDFDIGAIK